MAKFGLSPILVLFMLLMSGGIVRGQREMVPAMFIFGDSLIDNGNNNNLPSFAKANYYPYGIDFNGGPTGRFSNGYTMVDEIGISLSFINSFFFFLVLINHIKKLKPIYLDYGVCVRVQMDVQIKYVFQCHILIIRLLSIQKLLHPFS